MKATDYRIYAGNLKKKFQNWEEGGRDLRISVIFFYGRQKEVVIERGGIETVKLIGRNLRCEKPDKIRIEHYNGVDAQKYDNFDDYSFQGETEEKPPQVPTPFQGFGEVDINRIVDERFQEKKRLEEYQELKKQVSFLQEENEEQKDLIESLENDKEKLEKDIETKSQVRYYAGMLGDVLESFGIAKDRIKKPLVSLMGIEGEDEKATQVESTQTDSSGIVEDEPEFTETHTEESPEDTKRMEIINLIAEYLKTTDNDTLANVFNIFSEIEQDTSVAVDILQFIATKK